VLTSVAVLVAFSCFPAFLQQVTGSDAAAVSAAQAGDPYGIRIALRPGHPLALLTWQQYIATVTRMSRTVEQQLQGPAVEALAAFNRERKLLVSVCTVGCAQSRDLPLFRGLCVVHVRRC
jgi:hypothetical protein